MKGFVIILTFCIFYANAFSVKSSIASRAVGPIAPTGRAPHACIVLVEESGLGGGLVTLGGGSIISPRHALTAAHLVERPTPVTAYHVGFRVGSNTRMFRSTFSIIHQDYNSTTYDSDIALIFLQGVDTFNAANIIPIETDPALPAPSAQSYGLVSWGFTAPDSNAASDQPHEATQRIASPCTFEDFETASTHFCGIDEDATQTVICPGDNGAGLFLEVAGDPPTFRLQGIASRILTGCATPQNTGYTRVSVFAVWIRALTGIA